MPPLDVTLEETYRGKGRVEREGVCVRVCGGKGCVRGTWSRREGVCEGPCGGKGCVEGGACGECEGRGRDMKGCVRGVYVKGGEGCGGKREGMGEGMCVGGGTKTHTSLATASG